MEFHINKYNSIYINIIDLTMSAKNRRTVQQSWVIYIEYKICQESWTKWISQYIKKWQGVEHHDWWVVLKKHDWRSRSSCTGRRQNRWLPVESQALHEPSRSTTEVMAAWQKLKLVNTRIYFNILYITTGRTCCVSLWSQPGRQRTQFF